MTDQPTPSRRAGLHAEIAAAMREHYLATNADEADADGNMPCRCGDWHEPGAAVDDESDWDSHLAETALSVLYREWPWLQAEAEDTAAEPAPAAPGSILDPTWLRDQYAAAMASADGWDWAGANFTTLDTPAANRYRKIAEAVLRVRDRHLDQLRQRLTLADTECQQWAAAESADAAAGSYTHRAEHAEETARRALEQLQEVTTQLAEEQHLYQLRTAQWRRVVQARDQRTASINRVRALHQPMQRGALTICAHCSHWDEKRQRYFGVLTDYPCDTLHALAEPVSGTAPAQTTEHPKEQQ